MKIPDHRIRFPEGVIEIDGSYGEGGGQIVRTACALSCLTGVACRIRQIRAGRRNPGLRAQHCTALKGLALMCSAKTSSLKVGVEQISFSPNSIQKTELDLDTGTAGSVSLVLQALLLAALGSSSREIRFLLRGGTDVPGAPSCDFVKHVKLNVLQKMGYRVDLRILKRGYYPKGGGIVKVKVRPPEGTLLEPLQMPSAATDPLSSQGISHASDDMAKRHVAEKQGRAAARILTQYMHVRPNPWNTAARVQRVRAWCCGQGQTNPYGVPRPWAGLTNRRNRSPMRQPKNFSEPIILKPLLIPGSATRFCPTLR